MFKGNGGGPVGRLLPHPVCPRLSRRSEARSQGRSSGEWEERNRCERRVLGDRGKGRNQRSSLDLDPGSIKRKAVWTGGVVGEPRMTRLVMLFIYFGN